MKSGHEYAPLLDSPFWGFLRLEFFSRFAYRSALLLDILFDSMKLLVPILTWAAIFKNHARVGNYDFQGMVIYLVVANISTYLFTTSHALPLGTKIKSGEISANLIRPYSIVREYVAKFLGRLGVNGLLSSLPIIAIMILLGAHHQLQITGLGLILLLTNTVLAFSVGMCMGSLAFWLTETWPLVHFFRACLAVAGGTWFPLTLLPPPLDTILIHSPFAYLGHINVQVVLGQISREQTVTGIGISLAWSLGFIGLFSLLWKAGLRRYEAIGA